MPAAVTPAPARVLVLPPNITPRMVARSGEPYLLRSSAKGDEFSVLMPSQPVAVVDPLDYSFKFDGHTIKEERVFSSYAGGAVFLVKVLITSSGRKAFTEFWESRTRYGRDEPAEISACDVVLSGFKGKEEETRGKSNIYGESYYSRTQYFPTERNIYIISAVARDEHNPHIESFFSSLRLGDAASEAGAAPPTLGRPATAEGAPLRASETEQVLKPEEVSHKAIIVWQPDPGIYEEVLRLNAPVHKLKIQMVLAASGQVAEVKILGGVTPTINERVAKAAKYMKFIPAEKDGRPVSQWHTAEYVFRK